MKNVALLVLLLTTTALGVGLMTLGAAVAISPLSGRYLVDVGDSLYGVGDNVLTLGIMLGVVVVVDRYLFPWLNVQHICLGEGAFKGKDWSYRLVGVIAWTGLTFALLHALLQAF